ncbi:hypothetical protein LTR66_000605 [Elasticomyces elasticus]|nr:hypothetical protein LTR66_000605 [Elasticomyces elasticus]
MAEGESVGFVAAGVGVTPLLPCLGSLDLARLRLVWTLRMRDLGLVLDTFARHPELAERTVLFLTGGDAVVDTGEEKEQLGRVRESGAHVLLRRLCAEDLLAAAGDEIERWYVCTGTGLREQILQWLQGKEVIYEDFNF